MTTPLLQQALEALEDTLQSLCWLAFGECRNITDRPLLTTLQAEEKARSAITAIRAHLEEPKGEPQLVGFMNAGHVHELQQKRTPYGYVYPEEVTGASVAVYRSLPSDTVSRDAARYRWLREQHWTKSRLCVVGRPKESVKLGYDCPSQERLDAAIDAAMHSSTPTVGGEG